MAFQPLYIWCQHEKNFKKFQFKNILTLNNNGVLNVTGMCAHTCLNEENQIECFNSNFGNKRGKSMSHFFLVDILILLFSLFVCLNI